MSGLTICVEGDLLLSLSEVNVWGKKKRRMVSICLFLYGVEDMGHLISALPDKVWPDCIQDVQIMRKLWSGNNFRMNFEMELIAI